MDIVTMKSRHIPEEIITEEILPWLPVKSVLRFRSVSKAWCSLFGSERFIKTHLQLSAKNKARGSIISGDPYNLQHNIYAESLLKEEISCEPPLYITVVNESVCMSSRKADPELCFEVVGCCDGLVCIMSPEIERFFLWNPSTRTSKELPIGRIDLSFDCMTVFGWDESSSAYKVFAFGCAIHYDHDFDKLVEVYSSKTNSWSWKTILMIDDFDFYAHNEGKFVSGKLYWKDENCGSDKNIVWFDLKSEVFGVMELPTPVCPKSHDVLLGEYEGCLCVVSIERERLLLDVWVIKESSDWIHMAAALPLAEILGVDVRGPGSLTNAAPDGQIWLAYESGYLAYDPKRKLVLQFKQIQEGIEFYHPYLCIQSLVRP